MMWWRSGVIGLVVLLMAAIAAAEDVHRNPAGVPQWVKQASPWTAGDCLVTDVGGNSASFTTCPGGGGGMTSFTLAGSSGTNQTITNGNTLTIGAGTGITTTGVATDTVTVGLDYSATLEGNPALGAGECVFDSTERGILCEGGTANDSEIVLQFPNTAADAVVTLPNTTTTLVGNNADTQTWGSGSGSTIAWTFGVAGTDPVLTFGDGTVNVTGTLQQGGTAVSLVGHSHDAVSDSGTASGASITYAGGTGISTSATGSTLTTTFAPTELGSVTWGSGSPFTWTYDVSAGTDPVWSVSNGVMNLSAGELQQGGTAVSLVGHTHTGMVTGTGTDNHVPRWDGTGVSVLQDSSVVILDAGDLNATHTSTLTSGATWGVQGSVTASPATASSAYYYAMYGFANTSATADLTNSNAGLVALNGVATCGSSAGCYGVYGAYGLAQKTSTGQVTNAYGLFGGVANSNASSSITNAYGLYVAAASNSGTIDNLYALYTAGTETNSLGGPLQFRGSSSGSVTLAGGTSPTPTTYTLPASPPTRNGEILSSTTAGVMSWVAGRQRKCVSTGSISAAAVSNVCVTWDQAFADANYTVLGTVYDTDTTDIAALLFHHASSKSTTQACSVLFNQDAATAHTGTLCLEGLV